MPWNYVTYIYRIGRAGRISPGHATSFISLNEDNLTLYEISRTIEMAGDQFPETLNETILQVKSFVR